LERNFSITDVSKWLSENPARFLRLESQKGKIAKGFDADLCVWKPASKFTVTGDMIRHRHKITPYMDVELYGVVTQTYLNGNCIFSNDKLNTHAKGRPLLANYA
jgi:allantoinase